MDQEIGQETTEQVVEEPAEGGAPTSPGGHPAWQGLYESVSEDLHPILRPHLDEADKNVQKRFEAINEKYEPWQEVISNNDPNFVQKAVQYAAYLESNPQQVYEALKQQFGTETPPAEPTPTPEEALAAQGLDPEDPVAQQLLATQEQVAQMKAFIEQQQQYQTQQQQQALMDQQRQQFEATMAGLKAKHGDFDELVVTAYIAAGLQPEEAVKTYTDRYGAPAPVVKTPPPPVAGSGGGLPSDNQINPGKMTNQQVDDLVAQMLEKSK